MKLVTPLHVIFVICFATAAVAADEAGQAPAAPAKKRALIINIPASDTIPKAETEILDGVLCSEASKVDALTVICAGNVDVLNKHKDFAQQFGGSGCAKGQCMEGLVDRYQPDLIVRTTAKKSGGDIEFTMNLLNQTGKSTLATRRRTPPPRRRRHPPRNRNGDRPPPTGRRCPSTRRRSPGCSRSSNSRRCRRWAPCRSSPPA